MPPPGGKLVSPNHLALSKAQKNVCAVRKAENVQQTKHSRFRFRIHLVSLNLVGQKKVGVALRLQSTHLDTLLPKSRDPKSQKYILKGDIFKAADKLALFLPPTRQDGFIHNAVVAYPASWPPSLHTPTWLHPTDGGMESGIILVNQFVQ